MRFTERLTTQRDALVESLAGMARENHGRLYAIVDRAHMDEAASWQKVIDQHPNARNLFEGQPEEPAQEQAPWLFAIDDTEDAPTLLRRIVTEALRAPCVVWLSSPLDVDEMASRLSRRMSAQVNGSDMLLRFYDPRLFPTLWQALSIEQQKTFGAFATHWYYLGLERILQATPLVEDLPVEHDPFEPPLALNSAQVDALLEESERHQLMEFLGKRQPDAFFALRPAERYRHVVTHDHQARQEQIASFAERLRYCEQALLQGANTG